MTATSIVLATAIAAQPIMVVALLIRQALNPGKFA